MLYEKLPSPPASFADIANLARLFVKAESAIIVLNAWPSAVLIVCTPLAESKEVDDTPATVLVPMLSTNPYSLIVIRGIKTEDPCVPAAYPGFRVWIILVNVPPSAVLIV